jgi:ATP-dependent Clp protease ATP-binding subunit ClpB
MAERPEQPEQPQQETRGAGSEILETAVGLAILVGTPIAVGWLSEKMQQSREEHGSATTVQHGRALPADSDEEALPPPVSPLLYERAARDITAQDRRGELPEILWRGREIDQLATLLGGSRPESVLLVGETGIGKTALVEGLVQSIHAGQAPDLRRYAILSFRPDCLTNASERRHPGEQAETFLGALSEARDEVIAFFDDFQAFAELGDRYPPNQRAVVQLQQALAERRIRCIAAVSIDGYRRHIESDPAWKRCFTEVRLEKRRTPDDPFGELGPDKAFAILQQRARDYPALYELEAKPQAIEETIRLAERRLPVEQLPTKCLPGKAIRLLEETAKRRRPRWDAPPRELTMIDEQIAAAEMKRSRSTGQATRSSEFNARIEDLRRQRRGLERTWTELKTVRENLGQQVMKTSWLHRAIESATLNQADGLTDHYRQELKALQARRHETEEKLEPLLSNFMGLKDYLGAADVDRVFSELTGIPVTEVGQDEQELLMNLEHRLHQRVVGQDPAVTAVAKALRRARAGVRDEGRPIGNFMFLGPSGVGKTELAKALAETMFGDEEAMKRIDMGEYYGEHCKARLIGAPPGYVGYEGGGELTEAVRRRPNSVILFDEIEKADPTIFDALLQVLDDGRLTDGQGRTVDFKHTIIIMTSNVGSRLILDRGADEAQELVLQRLRSKSSFRPEFLNRMDDIIFFDPLTQKDLRQIAAMEFRRLQSRMQEREGIDLRMTEEAKDLIIEQGYDPVSGAREINRTMQEQIADQLAPIIISRKAQAGDELWVDREGDEIRVLPRIGSDWQDQGN